MFWNFLSYTYPDGIDLFKVNKCNIQTLSEIANFEQISLCSGVSIVNFALRSSCGHIALHHINEIRDRHQISLLILCEFERINFYSHWCRTGTGTCDIQKTTFDWNKINLRFVFISHSSSFRWLFRSVN